MNADILEHGEIAVGVQLDVDDHIHAQRSARTAASALSAQEVSRAAAMVNASEADAAKPRAALIVRRKFPARAAACRT
jgi:hypothetical protein